MKVRVPKTKRALLEPVFQVEECLRFSKEIEAMRCGAAVARFMVSPERLKRLPALSVDVGVGLGTVKHTAKYMVEQRKYSGRVAPGTGRVENPYASMIKAAEKVRTLASELMREIGDPTGYAGSGKPRALPKRIIGSIRKGIERLEASVDKVRDSVWNACTIPVSKR